MIVHFRARMSGEPVVGEYRIGGLVEPLAALQEDGYSRLSQLVVQRREF